jgi:hypothetical protein
MRRVTAALWPAYKKLLQRSKRPVFVGPFRGEVGFESLYWSAFVRHLGIAPERLIPVTRGGAHVWYDAERAVELYALRDPRDVRVENIRQHQSTGELKQRRYSKWDRAVIKDAAKLVGVSKYHVLHPLWMFAVLNPIWTQEQGLEGLAPHLNIQPLPAPPLPEGVKLPDGFVACRFYARTTFPPGEVSNVVTREMVKKLAAEQPVVMLNPGVYADEHVDISVKGIPNVYQLRDLVPGITPQTNLAVQSAIIGRAQGFVGTYGGLAQLALRYGKPSISVYTNWEGTALAHKQFSEALSLQLNVPFVVVRVTEIPMLLSALPQITISSSQARLTQEDRQIPTQPAA